MGGQGPGPPCRRAARPWVVAQHAPHEGPGLLAEVFAGAGVDVHVVRVDLGELLPNPQAVGGAVVMGGAMGVHDDVAYPWLATERQWLARAVDEDVAVLGICLGAQQLAAALGAAVYAAADLEVGVGEVVLSEAGRRDAVLGPEAACIPAVHWHGDTFDIPAGAEHLASSDRCHNQAFRYATRVYGLQFHLEVDDALAAAWAPELPAGVHLETGPLRAVQAAGRRVFGRFVAAMTAL